MRIQIKQDIDAWVVYVNGKVHPQGTGFPTQQAAREWIQKNIYCGDEMKTYSELYRAGKYTVHFDENNNVYVLSVRLYSDYTVYSSEIVRVYRTLREAVKYARQENRIYRALLRAESA